MIIIQSFPTRLLQTMVWRYTQVTHLPADIKSHIVSEQTQKLDQVVISRVLFPIICQIQDDHQRFRQGYIQVIGAIALITFPWMLGLYSLSDAFVMVFFDPQWSLEAILLMIFTPIGLAQSIGTTVGAIYQAKGRPDLLLYWGIGSGLFVVAAFAVGLRWGLLGVASAYAITSLILLYREQIRLTLNLVGVKR